MFSVLPSERPFNYKASFHAIDQFGWRILFAEGNGKERSFQDNLISVCCKIFKKICFNGEKKKWCNMKWIFDVNEFFMWKSCPQFPWINCLTLLAHWLHDRTAWNFIKISYSNLKRFFPSSLWSLPMNLFFWVRIRNKEIDRCSIAEEQQQQASKDETEIARNLIRCVSLWSRFRPCGIVLEVRK